MQVYKTTPDNISNLITFQISIEDSENLEEGILLTNCNYNVFLPNYTNRFNETLTELQQITNSLKDYIEQVKQALTNFTTDILPSNGGGPITSGSFATNIQTVSANLDTIKNGLQDVDTKIDEIKERL